MGGERAKEEHIRRVIVGFLLGKKGIMTLMAEHSTQEKREDGFKKRFKEA